MSLPFGLTAEALAAAEAEADPSSPAASARLRRSFAPELAAAAVTQVLLRRRAETKFGPAAARMFFTKGGLEQATRPAVAAHHARRLVAAGARRVVDLGCGIGTDAAAFAAAGLSVTAVERDPDTAAVARANLPTDVEVVIADATAYEVADDPQTALFLDPARRTGRGRSWRVEDLSPSWDFVLSQLPRSGPVGVKLGPGFPRALLPEGSEVEWVSDHRDTVEAALWSGPGSEVGRRSALVLPDHRLVARPDRELTAGPVKSCFYEPIGVAGLAGVSPTLAAQLGATAVHERLPYLTADELRQTPFATAFRVLESWAYREKDLRAWVRARDIGTLEILTRGLDLDPTELRRRLRLTGSLSATIAITPTQSGKQVLVLERVPSKLDTERD